MGYSCLLQAARAAPILPKKGLPGHKVEFLLSDCALCLFVVVSKIILLFNSLPLWLLATRSTHTRDAVWQRLNFPAARRFSLRGHTS